MYSSLGIHDKEAVPSSRITRDVLEKQTKDTDFILRLVSMWTVM
jgi:hypothetical protein